MAPRWRFLDNVSGDRADKSLKVDSKWWFLGTRDELFAWLPTYKTNANFALLDSTDGTSGTRWCPDKGGGATDFAIQNVRYTALDRFEYQVDITAIDFSKGGSGAGGGNYTFPDRSKLATEVTVDMVTAEFPMTGERLGFKWEGAIPVPIPGWDKAKSYPFDTSVNPLLTVDYMDRILIVINVRETSYLSGTPASNQGALLGYKGIKTINGVAGRVVERNMRLIYDTNGAAYTEWTKAVQQAPTDVGTPPVAQSWNSGWKDY